MPRWQLAERIRRAPGLAELPAKVRGRRYSHGHVAMAPVETKEQVVARLKEVEGRIRRLGVRRLALFGSFVRSAAGPESDVDFLVEFDPARKSFDNLLSLADLLESTLGRRVEVVTTAALSPYVGPHILKEAEDVIRAA